MSTRQEKVAELLREEISSILIRDFSDPRLGFITVTGADVSPDMAHAKVYVSIMGNEEKIESSLKVLRNGKAFVRTLLAKRMKMRTVPEIDFRIDISVDKGVRMLELLEQIKHDDKPSTD